MILVLENEVDLDTRYFVPEIVRHLRSTEAGADIRVEVYDYAQTGGQPSLQDVDGVVVAGSTAGVYEASTYPWMAEQKALVRELLARRIPILGVCFGHQLINDTLGGQVEHRGLRDELVRANLSDDPLFDGVGSVIPAIHGDVVVRRGDGMRVIGSVEGYENFATRHRNAPIWTIQYHPEFTARLKPRIKADFGWTENRHSFADVTAARTLSNFARIVTATTA